MTTTAEIWELLEPYLAAERLDLDDIELTGSGSGRVLRIAIDGEKLDIERLSALSRSISRKLDNETSIDGSYRLEVTTPGLERKLRRPDQFARAIGREIVAKVEAADSKRTVRGILADASKDSFSVDVDDQTEVFRYEDLVKANTVFRWEKSPKPGH
ncbi:MAG TPA: ribosome maturation factor RimP [Acidimicrobiia bacterium]